jgi:hypothetical protein
MKNNFVRKCLKISAKACLLAVLGLGVAGLVYADDKGGDHKGGRNGNTVWLNHFGLVSDAPGITSVDLGTPGTPAIPGGLAVTGAATVQMVLDLPKESKVSGVSICYTATNPGSISTVSLSQVQVSDPTLAAKDVDISPAAPLASTTPVCVSSKRIKVRAKNGPIVLKLGVTGAKVVIHGVGVNVK